MAHRLFHSAESDLRSPQGLPRVSSRTTTPHPFHEAPHPALVRPDKQAGGCQNSQSHSSGNFAAIFALKCETDFVAKNADFIALTKSILDAAIANKPANMDELKAMLDLVMPKPETGQ